MADTQQLAALIEEVSRLSNTVGDTLALLRAVSEVGAAAVDIAEHNNNPDVHAALFGAKIRKPLTRITTFYVRPDGNDSNDGLADTPGRAVKTSEGAVALLRTIDTRGYAAILSFAPGEYGELYFPGPMGDGIVSVISTDRNNKARISRIRALNGAFIGVGHIALNPGFYGLDARNRGQINVTGDLDFHGNINYPIIAMGNSVINVASSINLNFNGVTASITVDAEINGVIILSGAVFNGSVAGKRYSAASGGVIATSGKPPDYIPGTTAGTTATGGQYV